MINPNNKIKYNNKPYRTNNRVEELRKKIVRNHYKQSKNN